MLVCQFAATEFAAGIEALQHEMLELSFGSSCVLESFGFCRAPVTRLIIAWRVRSPIRRFRFGVWSRRRGRLRQTSRRLARLLRRVIAIGKLVDPRQQRFQIVGRFRTARMRGRRLFCGSDRTVLQLLGMHENLRRRARADDLKL